jgi:hypothetical protein
MNLSKLSIQISISWINGASKSQNEALLGFLVEPDFEKDPQRAWLWASFENSIVLG